MSPEACALLGGYVFESLAQREGDTIDDDIVLAQREADWAAFIADVERDWRL